MRWTGSGKIESEGNSIYYSGGLKHERGVGIILNPEMSRAVISWEPINDRIITIRMQARYTKVTLIQVYAPTNTANDQEKDEFYEQIQDVLANVPEHNMKLVMRDFNAQVGRDNNAWEETMGKEAIGDRTDNGERLLSYCSSNKLKIGGSLFQHKDIHKGTRRSPSGQTVNQIDHICISRRWASALQDVRVYRGADVGSDHYLVVAEVKVKLKCLASKKNHKILAVEKFKIQEIKHQCNEALQNRFIVLAELEEQDTSTEQGVESVDI